MNGQKILAILSDEPDFQSSVEFAFQLFENSNALVVAAFLNEKGANIQQRRNIIAELQNKYGKPNGFKLVIRPESGLKISDLKKEIRYTDLIIYPAKFDSTEQFVGLPLSFTKLLSQIKVPMLLAPKKPTAVTEVFLACDGNLESIKSIKQFCQVMSGLCQNTRITLLEFNHNSLHFQPNEEKLLIEYLKQHCSNLGVYKVSDESPDKILQLINFSKNAMIVSGTINSIGKSLLSLPAFTRRLVTKENTLGFFGGY